MTTSPRQIIDDVEVPEKKTSLLTLALTDETDAVLTGGVTTCTLTLYDKATRSIINSRNAQTILNANGGAIAAGVLTLTLSDQDNAMVYSAADTEEHVALIEWTWNAGTKKGVKEITFTVINLEKVT